MDNEQPLGPYPLQTTVKHPDGMEEIICYNEQGQLGQVIILNDPRVKIKHYSYDIPPKHPSPPASQQ